MICAAPSPAPAPLPSRHPDVIALPFWPRVPHVGWYGYSGTWTPERIVEVCDCAREGLSAQETADKLGCSVTTMRIALGRHALRDTFSFYGARHGRVVYRGKSAPSMVPRVAHRFEVRV